MKRQALFVITVAATMLAGPAFADDGASGILGPWWGKNVFNFEPMPSGPQPILNLSRQANGKANNGRLVGDWHNPIFTPQAAAILKAKGERAISGEGFPNAQDQCRPMGPPFLIAMGLTLAMLPTASGDVTMLCAPQREQSPHSHERQPSGAAQAFANRRFSGRWDGNTLVIDTVGVENRRVHLNRLLRHAGD